MHCCENAFLTVLDPTVSRRIHPLTILSILHMKYVPFEVLEHRSFYNFNICRSRTGATVLMLLATGKSNLVNRSPRSGLLSRRILLCHRKSMACMQSMKESTAHGGRAQALTETRGPSSCCKDFYQTHPRWTVRSQGTRQTRSQRYGRTQRFADGDGRCSL